ncbi:F2P16.20-like protein isoform 2 [Hibiscus syriacus]|uniref:RNA polymerase II subunit B1 CTD phosphatase RPAP2 homolog n=1 Tax=Hibiscus syriacus TaxID=106335 RepID=A0A6A3D035_HIBSY|nr:F2P16.20-like protein isoform 2 [Hibiscus syriacus]
MAKDESISVSEAVHKIQLYLLDGIQGEKQLFSSSSLISRSDYEDVVTERSISNACGYPICPNPLPSEPRRRGRYRISLKEHRVYDLQETSRFCSPDCLINSRAFAGSLQEERCSVLNHAKLNAILSLFEDVDLGDKGLGKNGDLGFYNLRIKENEETKAREVSLVGPSNAIEGYVPQRELVSKPSPLKSSKNGAFDSSSSKIGNSIGDSFFSNGIEFTSTIIMNNEYTVSKNPGIQGQRTKRSSMKDAINEMKFTSEIFMNDEYTVSKPPPQGQDMPVQSDLGTIGTEAEKETRADKAVASSEVLLKSSLKSAGGKKLNRSVTWAEDKNVGNPQKDNLCEVKEMDTQKGDSEMCGSAEDGDDDKMLRFASAEACAMALSKAAAAADKEERGKNVVTLVPEVESELEEASVKWPAKPGIPRSDFFDPEDSWFDAPPEGFSLTLSTFATMWNALFEWITSSSLAYIYGRDETFHEEYLSVNGREYPHKIVLRDGRSFEIKETLAGCISRVLPAIVTALRLPIPISTLEQGMGRLLETMSFVEALPAFRMKQWQVIVLLFIDALSVCRIPALTPHMTNGRMLLHKVLDGAHISMEEYEVMKDLIIPLGRAPHFSSQSGA